MQNFQWNDKSKILNTGDRVTKYMIYIKLKIQISSVYVSSIIVKQNLNKTLFSKNFQTKNNEKDLIGCLFNDKLEF